MALCRKGTRYIHYSAHTDLRANAYFNIGTRSYANTGTYSCADVSSQIFGHANASTRSRTFFR
jgi:hypothetical protein